MDFIKLYQDSKAFTLIELMIVIAIIAIISAIAIPNFLNYRNKAYCSEAETNAESVAGAISDYYGMASRYHLPTIGDLNTNIANPVAIQGDPNTTIAILVTDRTGRCPAEYKDANDNWSGDVFTKYIR